MSLQTAGESKPLRRLGTSEGGAVTGGIVHGACGADKEIVLVGIGPAGEKFRRIRAPYDALHR
jgi:hypothetical protein